MDFDPSWLVPMYGASSFWVEGGGEGGEVVGIGVT
jgi:hypothetical protein